MEFQKITIAGAGVLGSQIAYQTALSGFDVTVYDTDIEASKRRILSLEDSYKRDMHLSSDDFQAGLKRLTYTTDLKEAVNDADYLIEALPESLEIKQKFYEQLSTLAPAKTVFASNSSTMLPSSLVKFVDRPAKFIHMHFCTQVWKSNIAEIMATSQTSPEVIKAVINFARQIKMVPIYLKKEQSGYILNSLLIPLLDSAEALWVNGIASPETIDKDWMISMGTSVGPFMMLDEIGLRTNYVIAKSRYEASGDPTLKRVVEHVKAMLDDGKTGREAGQGFYTYPHPAFEDPDFLK